jgi:dolichol-phosphate mannosyltransferase
VGYAFQIEMKYRHLQRIDIEAPPFFTDRTKGQSKMSSAIFVIISGFGSYCTWVLKKKKLVNFIK